MSDEFTNLTMNVYALWSCFKGKQKGHLFVKRIGLPMSDNPTKTPHNSILSGSLFLTRHFLVEVWFCDSQKVDLGGMALGFKSTFWVLL